ncbi:hypothetical protein ACP26C_06005 [Franconibacter helveticus 513]|nr:hypothetical protein [Franconibacter helveticus]MDU6923206.1 hypothetical protein [Franconibacter helveticus]
MKKIAIMSLLLALGGLSGCVYHHHHHDGHRHHHGDRHHGDWR